MSNYQRSSVYENTADVYRGSAKISISPYQAVPSYTLVGAQVGLTLTRNLETTEEQVDDAQGEQSVFNDEMTVTFDQYEWLSQAVENIMMGGTDTITNVAGTPVAGATDVWAASGWAFSTWVELEGQNGNGTAPTINSVTGSIDGALVVLDDYNITKVGTKWGIVVDDSLTVTTVAQTITINYDYTPSAGFTQAWGSGTVLNNFILKIEGSNDGVTPVRWDLWKCQILSTGALSFQSDDAEDRRLARPLEIICRADATYHARGAGGDVGLKTVG